MKKQSQQELETTNWFLKLHEQLCALDRKVDSLIGRLSSVKAEVKAAPQTVRPSMDVQAQGGPINRNSGRIMYKVICADCKIECEVPFKPSGDRPVYCKGCFALRKKGNVPRDIPDSKPKEESPVQVKESVKPVASKKKKAVAVKKPVKKVKAAAKKTQKKK